MTAQWRSRQWLLPRLAVTIALLLLGAAAGHFIGPPTINALPATSSTPAPTGPAAEAPTAAAVMPDLLALDEAVARRVLADARITAEITTTTHPAAGDRGRVVDQSPAAGAPVTGAVQLTLTTPANMPKLTGDTLASARAALEKLGAVVTVTRLVRPSAKAGTVAATNPAAGQPVTAVVTVSVNDPGRGLSLASLDSVDTERCATTSAASVDGIAVKDSVTCHADAYSGADGSWNLARKATMLTGTLGLADDGPAGRARVRLLGDGKVLTDRTVRFGTHIPLRVNVTGVLRLHVQVTTSSTDTLTVVLGDATLLANEAGIAALAGQS